MSSKSIIGNTACPVSPLLVTQLWKELDVSFRSYHVDYDFEITENILKYIVHKLVTSNIRRELPMKNIISTLKAYQLKNFLKYDIADSCIYVQGAMDELKQTKVDSCILYL